VTGRLTTNAVRSGYCCPPDEGWVSGCKTLAHDRVFEAPTPSTRAPKKNPTRPLPGDPLPYNCLPPFMILYSMPSTKPRTVNVPPTMAQTEVTKSYHLLPFEETTTAMGDKS